jgi:hypothetical protein
VSVASEINRIKSNIADAYTEAEAKGATMPATENSDNLADTVASIPEAVQPTLITKQITANGTYAAEDENADGYSEVTVDVASSIDSLIDGSITEIQSNVSTVKKYAFAYSSIQRAVLPSVTDLGNYAFAFSNLEEANYPLLTTIKEGALRDTKITEAVFPFVTNIESHAFQSCPFLKFAHFALATSIGVFAFYSSNRMEAIVLGKRATLGNASAISTGIVYVENDDLEWYSTATNWSALYGQGRIKSIDELPPQFIIQEV